MSELYLAVSHEENKIPYKFKMTDINVYSLEEAAFHVYKYWRESGEEFLSQEFIDWTRDILKLPYYASQLTHLNEKNSLSGRLVGFLSLFESYDEIRLSSLRAALQEWEARLMWERLKENADYLYRQGNPSKAAGLYKRALEYSENYQILNNYAMSLMKLYRFEEAAALLERAVALEPGSVRLRLGLAESHIRARNLEAGLRSLISAGELDPGNPDIDYMHGLLNLETGDTRHSIDNFKKALSAKYDPHYVYSLAQVYIRLRTYDKAAEALETIIVKDKAYHIIKADIHRLTHNIPAAIKSIEQALATSRGDAELWTKLAAYHRLDYDLTKAENAVKKALAIDPSHERARFESAKIKKAQGKTKEYQTTLGGILSGFKAGFRESM
ncbi:MAG: tetratricopeptide repeat protein [Defluviitaleaceae bacterium]|nr:tetratricopeptide repeat protein [Defluviitaleaceae bacterium]